MTASNLPPITALTTDDILTIHRGLPWQPEGWELRFLYVNERTPCIAILRDRPDYSKDGKELPVPKGKEFVVAQISRSNEHVVVMRFARNGDHVRRYFNMTDAMMNLSDFMGLGGAECDDEEVVVSLGSGASSVPVDEETANVGELVSRLRHYQHS